MNCTSLSPSHDFIADGRHRVGCNWHFVFMGYGDDWRERRRVFHQFFHPNAAVAYRPRELKVARELLRRLLESPDDFMTHLRQCVFLFRSVGYRDV